MNRHAAAELARTIEDVVRATHGVEAMYPSEPFAVAAVRAGAALLSGNDASLVRIGERDGRWRVRLAVGVEAGASARDTCAAVWRAVEPVLHAAGSADADVEVTVVYIAES